MSDCICKMRTWHFLSLITCGSLCCFWQDHTICNLHNDLLIELKLISMYSIFFSKQFQCFVLCFIVLIPENNGGILSSNFFPGNLSLSKNFLQSIYFSIELGIGFLYVAKVVVILPSFSLYVFQHYQTLINECNLNSSRR